MALEDYLNQVSLWDLANGIPLPDESVDQIMTSPPYYSLRSYKLEPSVWGGNKNCSHQWIVKKDRLHSGRGLSEGNTDKYSEREPIPDTPIESAFCSLCSAWRGCLGLEPQIEMYLAHLLGIFDEVKRVLKKSGTCWVNIGDSYASGGGLAVEQSPKRQAGIDSGAYPDNAPLARYRKTNPKSMLCIPERFIIGMCERDKDDIYELRKDLTDSQCIAILDEIKQYNERKE